MPTPFTRCARSLAADGFNRPALSILFVAILLSGWLAWLALAEVELYETTGEARLEVDRAAHPIEALFSGRVAATHLKVGREVKAGDALIELETESQRLQMAEEEARVAALRGQLAALDGQAAAERQVQAESRQAAPVAIDESRARLEEAEAGARAAADEARRFELLRANGLIAEVDVVRAKAEAEKRRAAADALRIAINRQSKDQRARDSSQQATLEGLRRDAAVIEGEIKTRLTTIERLRHEISQRLIVAPADGKLGEVADLRPGQVIREGAMIGAVIPDGKLRAVATFPPSDSLGRIRAGQHAYLRLDGFPWTEYGKVAAEVTDIASEPRSGKVRVELLVRPESAPLIPLQHGLPGSLEIQVARVTPAALVLRSLGKLLVRQ
ncbi:MAG TPA: HlyD family efflux transporter periplasmic adaptor subunit [Blastocatellia bacterium]|nr:HlyD family efflux transporter periplasmic adaptor subunit [Blastocatellia bacterium]